MDMENKSSDSFACWGKMTPEQMASCLLNDVYHPVSLCIALDEAGNVRDAHLFDTSFFIGEIIKAEYANEIWLLTNHCDGNLELSDDDWRNVKQLMSIRGRAHVRVFVVGEEIGCQERLLGVSGAMR